MIVGDESIPVLMIGDMGIKSAYVGDSNVYTRLGGYIFLQLDTSEEEH